MIDKLITKIASLLWDRDQSRIKSEVSGVFGLGQNATVNLTREVSGVFGLGQNATVNLTPFFNLLCRSENERN
jgi:hypothetical protein